MGSCVLIAQGYEPGAAMSLVADRRAVADPYAYHIRPRILRFAQEWEGITKDQPQSHGEH
jgi:hypothetical protein